MDASVVAWADQQAKNAKVSREEFLRVFLTNASISPSIIDYNEQWQSFIKQTLMINQEIIQKNTDMLEKLETTLLLIKNEKTNR